MPDQQTNLRRATYLAHYHRLANLYCGANRAHERNWRGAGRIDVPGIKALARLKAWAGEPLQFSMRATWESGFALFEERVQAIGASYREGALQARQAA
jgi:hypothetical protein